MAFAQQSRRKASEEEPSIDSDKLSYEIFSILETKFLFGSILTTSDSVKEAGKRIELGEMWTQCGYGWEPRKCEELVGIAEEMLKQKNVESVLFGGKKISEETSSEKLDWIAGMLVQEHQRRSDRIAPTVAFKQACPTAHMSN